MQRAPAACSYRLGSTQPRAAARRCRACRQAFLRLLLRVGHQLGVFNCRPMRRRFLGLDPGVGRSDIRRANTREQHLEAKGQLAKGEKVGHACRAATLVLGSRGAASSNLAKRGLSVLQPPSVPSAALVGVPCSRVDTHWLAIAQRVCCRRAAGRCSASSMSACWWLLVQTRSGGCAAEGWRAVWHAHAACPLVQVCAAASSAWCASWPPRACL